MYTTEAGDATCTGCFTYNPAVTIVGVRPARGPLAGGTAVTITGADFPPTVDSVRVGTGRLAGLLRVGATQLTGSTPVRGTAGVVDVTVYTTAAGNATCPGCFTFAPATLWTSLTAGYAQTCGVTNDPTAYCWGDNTYGEVGDASKRSISGPVAVEGGVTFVSVVAGDRHTCGLTSGGAAYCWGWNRYGDLGDGDTVSVTTPVAVAGGRTYARLAVGGLHTCGLTSLGTAYCWGWNQLGQLGDSSNVERWTPVMVGDGIAFTTVTTGELHTCGLASGGVAFSWGDNRYGQLGNGTTGGYQTRPVAVSGGIIFAQLTSGAYHTYALTSAGAAYCWGSNGGGQLGDGSTNQRLGPVAVNSP